MFDDHDGPPLHIPDEALRKPRGAEVGDDGKVACVACGNRILLGNADVVGQGYRCPPCSHQAHVASLERGGTNVDASAHLSPHLRDEMRSEAQRLIRGGITITALGVVVVLAMLGAGLGVKLGLFLVAVGLGLATTGSIKKSAAG